ncbi:Mechanosensitive ion channel-domain-containing protein [Mycotypha africana]|uniref:Mechanosensitive ion channel-domain-containing protein n=1 Tax=Mycotypha africana TaxID=64632 RepID=UPI002300D501|nr:Mechanosensitive ion channel-domain-containing protein [Mycotypha africana]KAI8968319.1 Mechanosensitive ion channel-domain-containing protein [Mycotypha africana]
MTKKGKSVRIASEEDESLVIPDTLPLVPPPPSAAGQRSITGTDKEAFYSIEMQQEDPFFYDQSSDNANSTYNRYPDANVSMLPSSSHNSWSSMKTTVDPHAIQALQDPFKDTDQERTLAHYGTALPSEDTMKETVQVLRHLEYDEEKQELDEDRTLASTANSTVAATTTTTTTTTSTDEDDNHDSKKYGFVDSDHEFDWNDDPDQQAKPKRRKTARERFTAVMRRPCCWHYLSPIVKRILIALFGSCMFITVAIVIYFTLPEPTEAQQQDPNFTNIRSNVQCWMYWAAFMWHIFWITTWMLDLVPSIVSLWTKLFRGRRSERVKSYMEYYMSLKQYFALVFLAAWNLGAWAFLIDYPFKSLKLHAYSFVVTKVFGCILSAAGLYFIQKLVIQIIAIKFHRTAFSDRLKENKKSLKILDTLSKAERKTRPSSTAVGGSYNNNLRKRHKHDSPFITSPPGYSQLQDTNSSASSPQQKSSFFSQFSKSVSSFVLAEKPTATTGRLDKNKTDINSDDYAKKVAKKLFYSLAYPDGLYGQEEDPKKCLTVYSFLPFFDTREEATEAFTIFDKDGNGDLTRREFRDTVVYIYRERKGLAQAIRDTSQALGKLDTILFIIFLMIDIVICLSIFHVDFWTALIPFGTFLAACTFVFDTSAKSLFTGILFQFVTHPYDAGDLVMIDSTYMTVENIGILGTVFVAGDGTKTYAPTSVLLTKLISNIRRSEGMGETLTFNIDFRTDNDLILLLRERLLEWVQSQSRDFAPGFDLRVTDIKDMNQVILTCWLPHKSNWVDLGKRFQRKTRFMLALKAILTDLGIQYELPAQRITSTSSLDNHPFTTVKPQNFAQQQESRSA